jgi:hypothetical protein
MKNSKENLSRLFKRTVVLLQSHSASITSEELKEVKLFSDSVVPEFYSLTLLEDFEYIVINDTRALFRQPGVGDIEVLREDVTKKGQFKGSDFTVSLKFREEELPSQLMVELNSQIVVWLSDKFEDKMLLLSPRSFVIAYLTERQADDMLGELYRIHRDRAYAYIMNKLESKSTVSQEETTMQVVTLDHSKDKDGKYLITPKGIEDEDLVKGLEECGFSKEGKQKRAQFWWITLPEDTKKLVKQLKKAGVEATIGAEPEEKRRGRPKKDEDVEGADKKEAKAEKAEKADKKEAKAEKAEEPVVEETPVELPKANGETVVLVRFTDEKNDFLQTVAPADELNGVGTVLEAVGLEHYETKTMSYYWVKVPDSLDDLAAKMEECGLKPDIAGHVAGRCAKEILQGIFDEAGIRAKVKGKKSDEAAEMGGVTVSTKDGGYFNIVMSGLLKKKIETTDEAAVSKLLAAGAEMGAFEF